MLRAVLMTSLCVVLVLVAAGIGVWFVLEPPALEVPQRSNFVLRNITVVNPGLERSPGLDIEIESGEIASLSPSTGDPGEFSGYFALPGLIDSHVHLPIHNKLLALLFLSHGVTSVRDTGTLTSQAIARRSAVLAGEYPSPRTYTCGRPLDGAPPVPGRGNRAVATPEEARRAVADLAEAGVDCIKPYDNLAPEVMATIAEAAREHGLPVVGHVPLLSSLETAGVQDVQHLTGLPVRVPDADEPWAKELSFASVTPERIDAFVGSSLAHQISHTPTLVTMGRIVWLSGAEPPIPTPAASHLPRYLPEVIWRAAYDQAAAQLSDAERRGLARSLENMRQTTLRLHRAGVPVQAGTDMIGPYLVAGESLHEELVLLSELGLGPEAAWASATVAAASAIGDPRLGTIRAGAYADLLLFREDPSRDLAALETLEVVIAQGRVYRRATLDDWLERYDRFYRGPVVEGITMALARAVSGAVFPVPDSD